MNQEEQKKSITEEVLNKIKSGDIKMVSKIWFIFRTVLLVLGILILTLFIIYLVSFTLFSLRFTGVWFLPRFGFPGMRIFFGLLPWPLIFITAILIILLEVFAKKFSFVYRRPLVYSLLVLIVIALSMGFLIERTPFHRNLFQRAQEGNLPAIGPVYRQGFPPIENVHHGIVSEIINDGFIMETPKGEKLTVIINPETRLQPETGIKENDEVVVLGKKDNDTIQAVDIRKVERDFNLFRLRENFKPSPPPNFQQ